jgi:GTPase SAR1 family protein
MRFIVDPQAQSMSRLNVDLVQEKKWKLEHLEIKDEAEAIVAVRRRGNAYVLNVQGALIALSMTDTDIESLTLGEECHDLEHLYLGYNEKLTRIEFETNLPKLQHLYLNNCALNGTLHLPTGFAHLKQVYVQNNQLQGLVFEGDCPELELLDAAENGMTVLSMPNGFLNLKYLHLQKNQIAQLPDSFVGMRHLELLFLAGNPLADIPQDVVGSGDQHNSAKDLLAYLSSIQGKKTQYLHEAKMILVGNPMVGKSSIRIKLKDPQAELPKIEDRTPGLDVEPYILKNLPRTLTGQDQPIDFQLNIWDFGGQGRYREIQQLFCSRKSLYLYVTAYDDQPEKEDYIGLDYWLSMVNAYGFDQEEKAASPVIYVLNKIDVKDPGINETLNQEKYQNIVKFAKISCEQYRGFEQLIEYIRETLPSVSRDVFSNRYSPDWFRVKQRLENFKDNHLLYRDFVGICQEEGLDLQATQTWLSVLDRIGTVIYTGNFKDEQEWVILNPYWVKDAITKVIDSPYMQRDGILKEEYFDEIWKEYPSSADRENLVKLMLNEKYKLAYQIKSNEGKMDYMVPSALFKKDKPPFIKYPHLQQSPDFSFEFRFSPFIPAGIVNKLIVTLNEHTDITLIWKNGCVLHDVQSKVYVELEENWRICKIGMKLFGNQPFTFYNKIILSLEAILKDIKDAKFLMHLECELWMEYKGKYRKLSELEELGVFNFDKETGDIHSPQKIKNMGIEKEIEGLTNALNLLIEKKNQFEEDRAIASDSEKKFELRKKLEKLEKEINEYREKIHQLSGHSQGVEQKPLINKLEELIVKTDNLSSQVGEMHNQIKLSFKEVLSRLSVQDQQLISILQLSEASKAELAQSFLDLNEQVLDEEKMKDFVQEINNMVAEHILELPNTLQQQWKTLNSKAADHTDAKAKFKLKIPIIPAILEYETEVNWDIRKLAKEVWADFKAGNVFLKKKD